MLLNPPPFAPMLLLMVVMMMPCIYDANRSREGGEKIARFSWRPKAARERQRMEPFVIGPMIGCKLPTLDRATKKASKGYVKDLYVLSSLCIAGLLTTSYFCVLS